MFSFTFDIPDEVLDSNQREKLKRLFSITTDDELSDRIKKTLLCAICEYRDMFLGVGMPLRADEIKQYRLFYLIKFFFENRMPTEEEVCSMFQLPETRSRNLITNVMARFRLSLDSVIRNTLLNIIDSAQLDQQTQEYRVVIKSKNMVEELNRMISRIQPTLNSVKLTQTGTKVYSISRDTYDLLKRELNNGQ